MGQLYIGIDLGGTNMQIGVVDTSGDGGGGGRGGETATVIGRSRKKTQPKDGLQKIIDRMVESVETACRQAGVEVTGCAGLGIGAPGPADPEKGVILEAVNLRWKDVPLADLLRERLGVPVIVDNDVNVAVYGEWKVGAGKGCDDLMGVWLGTGIGGGLILNGRLYEGGQFTAGEIGHMTLFPGGPPGSRSVENNCSRSAVARRLELLISQNRPSVLVELSEGKLGSIKSRLIAQAYAQGDELTRLVVENTAEMLGVAIGGVVTLLGLPRIILGGGLTEALGEPFVKRVKQATRAHAFPDRCKAVEVVASALEDDAGLVGAALLAQERLG